MANPPHVPRYVSDKERTESRARIRRWSIGFAIAIPVFFAIMLLGYSDQAPAPLRTLIVGFDRMMGYPFLGLLRAFL